MAERRYDPLADRWVIVSPERVQRPWQGEESTPAAPSLPHWSADCYLCPRVGRASGATNPDYPGVHVFDNDFPALGTAAGPPAVDGLLQREPVRGRCRVLCYHPDHHRTLATLPPGGLQAVVQTWGREHAALSADHAWVQIFENKGRMMGCSSEHPHGQVWASDHVPGLPAVEDATQARHFASNGAPLLLDYLTQELERGERLVDANDRWAAVAPYWAAWPFETLLLPRRHTPDFSALDDHDQAGLAAILERLLGAYDSLFGVPMPYSMGWHGRGRDHGGHWQLHAHFYPPLLRSATVRKFMVGYEMLAEAQRDLTPEQAAARLRDALSSSADTPRGSGRLGN